LAYWKLEKELRLAQDSLTLKEEEVVKMEAYKKSLTEEMDELYKDFDILFGPFLTHFSTLSPTRAV